MIKNLRTLLVSTMLMVCGLVSAQTVVTFTAGTDMGTTTADAPGADQITKDGVTIAISNGAMATAEYRVYKNQTFTVSSTVGNITKIEVTCTAEGTNKQGPGCLENPTSGDYTYEGKNGTWTGEASEVTFSTPSNQCRMTVVVVTVAGSVDPNALHAPTIAGNTSFDGSTTVTITHTNEAGDIFYVKNAEEATAEKVAAEGTKYTEPFEITETTTISAVVKNGDKVSPVATKTFTKIELQTVENIAAFKALANNTEAKLTLTDAQVLYAGSNDTFVRDASGAIDFYNTGLTLTAGQKLNGFVIGKLTVYNGMPELVKTNNTNADGFTTTDGTVEPKAIGLDEVAGFACDLIVVSNVTLVKDGNNWYATNEDGDKIQVYDKFHLNYEVEDGKTYTSLTGIVIPYNDSFEIAPTEDFTGGAVIPATPVASIADLLALESPSSNLELTLTNAQVVFNDNNYIYVRENGSAVCFYNMSAALKELMKTNAVINGKIGIDYEVYRMLPEVKSNSKTDDNTLEATEGEEAAATATTLADVATGKHVCDLVTLKAKMVKEVTYQEDGTTVKTTTYYLQDGDVKLVIVNNGKNLNKIDEGTEVTVTAICNTANDAYQLKLTKNAEYEADGISTVNAGKADSLRYNLQGQRVSDSYKGVVIINGKKYVK